MWGYPSRPTPSEVVPEIPETSSLQVRGGEFRAEVVPETSQASDAAPDSPEVVPEIPDLQQRRVGGLLSETYASPLKRRSRRWP
jgi:hypothetical protein